MTTFSVEPADPAAGDVRALLTRHRAWAAGHSPPEDVHALDESGLDDPALTLLAVREDGRLVAVGGLRRLDPGHAELKAMHTAEGQRGRGLGRLVLEALLDLARERGVTRVSLETGTMEAFAAARALYASAGFRPCPPFADYRPSPHSVCLTRAL